jgi:hypothetical protein
MKRLIFLLAISVALLAPAGALASGVVLKVQRSAHLVAVTRSANHVALVHTSAAARLHVGQRVSMSARNLRNGTLAAASVRVVGRAHKVRFRGLLLAQSRTRLLVSAGGAVISVHRGSRTTSSARDHGGPQAGNQVDVVVTVNDDNDELDEDAVVVVAPMAPGGQIEGTLTIGTGQVTVTSEHMTLVLNVPTGFDLTTFKNGDEVLATFTQAADTTLTLSALSLNADAQQADEDDGDDDGDHGGGGGGDDHGGGGGGGGGHDGHH